MWIKGLIFDFDGLILETETPEFEAWREIYQAHGCELPVARWLDCIGREATWFDAHAHLEELAGRSLDRSAILARREARKVELVLAQDVLPGVRALHREARERGLTVAIASSATPDHIRGHLARLWPEAEWHAIVHRGGSLRAKPAPDLYLAAVEALGIAAGEALALEDSANGITAARAAGLRCVAVPNPLTALMDLSHADARLESLAGVTLDALAALTAGRGPRVY